MPPQPTNPTAAQALAAVATPSAMALKSLLLTSAVGVGGFYAGLAGWINFTKGTKCLGNRWEILDLGRSMGDLGTWINLSRSWGKTPGYYAFFVGLFSWDL